MKTFIKSIRLTLVFCVFFTLFYILVLWGFSKIAGPNHGLPAVTKLNGKVVGATNIGQSFGKNVYFWGRPSCAGSGYDAANSGGSNKGPGNKEYLSEVNRRIVFFLHHHPYRRRKDIPAEMVTASGSGLDPNISTESAYIQIKRVAKARGCSEHRIKAIVDANTEHPLFGLFGPAKVNVLKLNVALDQI